MSSIREFDGGKSTPGWLFLEPTEHDRTLKAPMTIGLLIYRGRYPDDGLDDGLKFASEIS